MQNSIHATFRFPINNKYVVAPSGPPQKLPLLYGCSIIFVPRGVI